MSGFPGGPVVNNLPANAGDTGFIPGPGKYHMSQHTKSLAPQLALFLLVKINIKELKINIFTNESFN